MLGGLSQEKGPQVSVMLATERSGSSFQLRFPELRSDHNTFETCSFLKSGFQYETPMRTCALFPMAQEVRFLFTPFDPAGGDAAGGVVCLRWSS